MQSDLTGATRMGVPLMGEPLLSVENLALHYRTRGGAVRAVDGVSFDVKRGEALVILGESGCGKSSLARALMRLLPRNLAHHGGRVRLGGTPISELSDERFRREVQWSRMALVMQASMNALNPVVKVGEQVAEPLRELKRWPRRRALERAAEVFQRVGLPLDFMARYPFELSGGMRQRAVLAMALVAEPELVILDEPTSALDVLTQAAIMNVLKELKRDLGTSFILITHDVATSSELADRVALMYAGELVEACSATRFFGEPAHPYSRLLMKSVPRLHARERPRAILGQPPSLLDPPAGCRFAARCPERFARCGESPPAFALGIGERAGEGAGESRHRVRCWRYEPNGGSGHG
ncbi:MAG: ABC transporter ATP-binding protein [Pseudomonadota bacterium]